MKIITLVENTSGSECLMAEHGLSLYMETENHRFLFDAGESGCFVDNAKKLGVDLKQAEFAVLSHGHYDHGNGLVRFLEENDHAPVYVSPYVFEPRYNQNGKYIGLHEELQESNRLRFTREGQQLGKGMTLYSQIPLPNPIDPAGLLIVENGIRVPEDFRHEQYLLVEEGGKRILLSGCSHKGILNIVDAFRPDILIGGFHFMKITDEERLQAAAKKLMEYGTVYYTGHCTGLPQYDILKANMGDRLHYLSTGTVLEI